MRYVAAVLAGVALAIVGRHFGWKLIGWAFSRGDGHVSMH